MRKGIITNWKGEKIHEISAQDLLWAFEEIAKIEGIGAGTALGPEEGSSRRSQRRAYSIVASSSQFQIWDNQNGNFHKATDLVIDADFCETFEENLLWGLGHPAFSANGQSRGTGETTYQYLLKREMQKNDKKHETEG